MADLVHAKQLEYFETNDEDMEQDEEQIIETLVKEEEDKEKQPIATTRVEPQNDDLTIEKLMVIVNLSVQEDTNEISQVYLNLQVQKQGPPHEKSVITL